jgi:hypothetical protein
MPYPQWWFMQGLYTIYYIHTSNNGYTGTLAMYSALQLDSNVQQDILPTLVKFDLSISSKIKLSCPCVSLIKHYAMKNYGGLDVHGLSKQKLNLLNRALKSQRANTVLCSSELKLQLHTCPITPRQLVTQYKLLVNLSPVPSAIFASWNM